MEQNTNYKNQEQDRRIEVLEKHIATINDELNSVKIDMAEIRANVCWLRKSYWIIITASLGGLATALINLLSK